MLADSVSEGAGMQFMVNVIGQAPLGFGIFLLWPLIRNFGKRMVMMIGFTIAAVGSLATVLMSGLNMGLNAVLGALILRSIGQIPYYVMSAMLAEALDHIEWKNGVRVDGFSAAIYSIIMTVFQGIGQSILLGGINLFGYINPENVEQHIAQPLAMKYFFIFTFVGMSLIAFVAIAIILRKYDLEKMIPQISAEINARRKAEAEARGEVYCTPEELAEQEKAENDRLAEENRVRELREKCAKKGLSFDEEEAKYQKKKAEAEAKAAKKNAGRK